jgi:hypothetical protein
MSVFIEHHPWLVLIFLEFCCFLFYVRRHLVRDLDA